LRRPSKIATFAFIMLVAGCASQPSSSSRQWRVKQAALPIMEQVTVKAQNCWFKSGMAAFKPYRLAPELHSFSDRPRILLVPYATPTARPLLVVEASGAPATVSAYGPLLESQTGKHIVRDLGRWLDGQDSC